MKLPMFSARTKAVSMLRTRLAKAGRRNRGLSSSISKRSPLWRTDRIIIPFNLRILRITCKDGLRSRHGDFAAGGMLACLARQS